MARRERATIVGELLEALASNETASDPAAPTRLAARLNVPYDRFVSYLDDAVRGGLVTAAPALSLTDAGREVLDRYRAWREALRLFGLGGPDA